LTTLRDPTSNRRNRCGCHFKGQRRIGASRSKTPGPHARQACQDLPGQQLFQYATMRQLVTTWTWATQLPTCARSPARSRRQRNSRPWAGHRARGLAPAEISRWDSRAAGQEDIAGDKRAGAHLGHTPTNLPHMLCHSHDDRDLPRGALNIKGPRPGDLRKSRAVCGRKRPRCWRFCNPRSKRDAEAA